MIRFIVVGGGWRAAYYVHTARMLPELMQVTGVMVRGSEKRAAFARKYGVPAVETLDELLAFPHDFALNAGGRMVMHEIALPLLERGIPVLSETPPAADTPALIAMWNRLSGMDTPFLVAEQCFLRPYQQAVQAIIDGGMIGAPVDVTMSMFHEYHALSLIRMNLGTGMEPCRISARTVKERLVETAGRGGLRYGGGIIEDSRQLALIEFESGKSACIDFIMDQYFSHIRATYTRVRGERGEIFGDEARYISPDGEFISAKLRRAELGRTDNLEGFSLRGIMLGDKYIYRNPLEEKSSTDYKRLNDDEIAVAGCLIGMKRYIEGGEPFYPLAAAFQDAYLANLLTQAAEEQMSVCSERMPWCG